MSPDVLVQLLAKFITMLFASLREEIRQAVTETLATAVTQTAVSASTRLLSKQGLADALDVSTAKIDRLCREQRIPFVLVGTVKRFELSAVIAALKKNADVGTTPTRVQKTRPVNGVRLLSRGSR